MDCSNNDWYWLVIIFLGFACLWLLGAYVEATSEPPNFFPEFEKEEEMSKHRKAQRKAAARKAREKRARDLRVSRQAEQEEVEVIEVPDETGLVPVTDDGDALNVSNDTMAGVDDPL